MKKLVIGIVGILSLAIGGCAIADTSEEKPDIAQDTTDLMSEEPDIAQAEPDTEYCFEVLPPNTEPKSLLSDTDESTVRSLFDSNDLDYSNNIQCYSYNSDSFNMQHVKCYQHSNGLKIFDDNVIFHFKDGKYTSLSGHLVGDISLDTTFVSSPESVVDVFMSKVKSTDDIGDGCLNLRPGYRADNKNMVKTWKVSPKSKGIPYAEINDDPLKMYHYDNGIRF